MNLSFWERETFFNKIDIAIIGSGIVGLCASIELKAKYPSKKIVIFERGFLPSGASTKNAGFACFGSLSELLKDLDQFTENEVFSLVEKRWKGLNKLKKILNEKELGYESSGGYEIFSEVDEFQKCADYLAEINKKLNSIIGTNVYEIAHSKIHEFGFKKVSKLIFNQFEGLVNTGSMIKNLISKAKSIGVEIYNGIEIKEINQAGEKVEISISNNFYFTVNQVLITTNAFAKQLLPDLDLVPGRGQVLVTKPIENLKVKGAFHFDSGYYYFRNIENRILLGGGRNLDFKAEETTDFGTTGIVQEKLISILKEVILPETSHQIDYNWSGIMAFGCQQEPIIKAIDSRIFCAVKCQGMGVALGALIGEKVADLMEATL
ncbi:MAG: FAD-dependent oxidoreductase [Bacteroidota bacterium]